MFLNDQFTGFIVLTHWSFVLWDLSKQKIILNQDDSNIWVCTSWNPKPTTFNFTEIIYLLSELLPICAALDKNPLPTWVFPPSTPLDEADYEKDEHDESHSTHDPNEPTLSGDVHLVLSICWDISIQRIRDNQLSTSELFTCGTSCTDTLSSIYLLSVV